MKTIHDEGRIEMTGQFIADELKTLLDRYNHESPLGTALRARCPAYKSGLTNAEHAIATLRALALAQIEITRDIASMTMEHGDLDELDDDEAA